MQKSNDNADSTLWLKMRETAESMMRAGKPAAEARDALVEIMQAHLGQPNSPPSSRLPMIRKQTLYNQQLPQRLS